MRGEGISSQLSYEVLSKNFQTELSSLYLMHLVAIPCCSLESNSFKPDTKSPAIMPLLEVPVKSCFEHCKCSLFLLS